MTTPKTGAPELVESQADKEETVNEMGRRIEAGAGLFRIEDNDATAPPGSCADGACYIPAATATGAWAGKEKYVAIAVGTNAASGWYFIAPEEGMRAWVKDENAEFAYDGSAWTAYSVASAVADGDKGDITLTSSGTVWTIDNDTITNAKLANMATQTFKGRTTASTGDPEDLTVSQAAALLGTAIKSTESLIIACSDETTAITTGTAKVTFRMPYAFTLSAVRASVTTAPTGSTILIDINESGTTILSTKLMIDASEKTSTTAATAAVISDSSLADDAEMTIDFDQVGSTIAGAGVKVYLIGTRT